VVASRRGGQGIRPGGCRGQALFWGQWL